jgi:hypothetical protein
MGLHEGITSAMAIATMRKFIGIAVLATQFGMIVYARFVPERVFTWAPNDYMVEYATKVSIDGQKLTPEEVTRRYRWPAQGIYNNSAQDYFDYLTAYETTYGKYQHAQVLVRYSVNGSAVREWTWPHP